MNALSTLGLGQKRCSATSANLEVYVVCSEARVDVTAQGSNLDCTQWLHVAMLAISERFTVGKETVVSIRFLIPVVVQVRSLDRWGFCSGCHLPCGERAMVCLGLRSDAIPREGVRQREYTTTEARVERLTVEYSHHYWVIRVSSTR